MRSVAERFWAKVDKSGECWLWTGARSRSSDGSPGYGNFRAAGENISSHRFSWVLAFGEVPVGKLVLHRCDVRNCVNPEHLFLGDYADNMADMMAKGRFRMGRRNRLTSEDVELIRLTAETLPVTQAAIAKAWGISGSVIHHVLRGNYAPRAA